MAEMRKIIHVEDSGPLISKKKKNRALISGGIVLILVAAVIITVLLSTAKSIKQIGDYTVAIVTSGSLTSTTEASGTVVLPTQVSIASMEDDGYAKNIYVKEGDYVTPSTVLARLYVPDLEDSKVDILNSLETQKLSLEEIQLNNEFTKKENEVSLGRLNTEIADAQKTVASEKALLDLKSSRQSDYDDAVDALTALQQKKEDLLLAMDKADKTGDLNLRKQNTTISQLKTSLTRVEDKIKDANITSPIAGEVLSLDEDLTVPGSLIDQGTTLFTVADTKDVFVDLEVYEQYSSYLKVGGQVDMVISNKSMNGEITQIGRVASMSSDGLAATITVRVKPVGVTALTPGASAVAEIPLGTKENAMLLPRGSYLTTGNQKYVYKIDGTKAYKTAVVFGDVQGSRVEVLKGLKPGDQVIISSYQNYIDQDVVEMKK